MITTLQEKEIVHYLLSKNLSRDLFFEIKDHFSEQISGLIDDGQVGFQEAFLKTKLSWNQELEMVRADLLSFRKITRLEKEILQKRFRNITWYALVFSLIFSSVIFIRPDMFMYFQVSLLVIMTGLLGYNFIFRKMRLFDYMQLSFHPLILKNTAAGIIIFSSLYLFYNDLTLVGSEVMKIFFLYAIAVKIQLLYFKARKTNVLI
ncbi:hypothetical protein LF887_21570 [Chryseobacterium sp. MEBOG06]|uniref:hypothetical protein n=1 Tax=Chryseobacterium sp. MEBOG06 TaxID=2879938 RepID=UPI001F353F5D|nr:hypothetical protein [Chryseobacterium sp. MEBOG06]UKB83566.1 hypothetical protein LF887_21570 [Chryseobacterium sp. MEBOG06]